MSKFLTESQVLELRLTHKQQREKKMADRVKAVLMLNSGFTPEQISQALLLDEGTIHRYVQKFQEAGVSGLLECHYTGGQARLTSIQKQELRVFLKETTAQTAKEVVSHLQRTYQLQYSLTGVTALLHRLGFVYKKPKVIPSKADRDKQQSFLQTYHSLKDQLKPQDQIYFMDATHPQHNTQLAYGWILKGKQNDKFVKTNTGRERLNLNGALALKNKTAVVLEEQAINSLATLK